MDVEAFDPMVNLLVEACATELERIQRDMAFADSRVINRVIEILTPDIFTGPQPAHAVMHARSVVPQYNAEPHHLVFTQKKIDKGSKDIYFSPAGSYPIVDGDVRLIVVGDTVFQLEEGIKRSVFLNAKAAAGLPFNVLYIGLELGAGIQSPEGIRFYFNWRNLPNREHPAYWNPQEVIRSLRQAMVPVRRSVPLRRSAYCWQQQHLEWLGK